MHNVEPQAILEHCMRASHDFIKLSWMVLLASLEEDSIVTHRGSVTPGEHNMKTFTFVQFDCYQPVSAESVA